MVVKSKARAKRGTLPFVAPELHYATKADVADVRTDIANVRAELKQDIADVRTDVAKLETKIIDVKSDMIKWMVGLNIATIGIITAMLALLR